MGACYLLLAHGEYHFVGFQAVQSHKETSGKETSVYVGDISFYGGCGFFGVSSSLLLLVGGAFIDIGEVHYSGKDVGATKYGTAEALYELTGVEFPEITPVDSSEYEAWDMDVYRSMTHKYVLPEDVDESFYERLKKACISNPDHWKITDSSGNGYCYEEFYYPKGDVIKSNSISVDVYGNTVTLREGGTNSPYYDGF